MDTARIDEILRSQVAKDLPWCRCLASVEGKTVYAKAFGFTDAQRTKPPKMTDIVHLFSATKLLTCAAGLMLAEQGVLDPDAPVCQYLPAFQHLMVAENGILRPAENTMTVRHLFTMTGGLDYNMERPHIAELCRKDPHASTQKIASLLAREPLQFEPGTQFLYSLCHDVLGAVLEVASGKSLQQLITDLIARPLGMTHTAFRPVTDETHAPVPFVSKVTGSLVYDAPNPLEFPSDRYESGGAGLFSTAEDYFALVTHLADQGGKPGSPFTPWVMAQLQTNRLNETQLQSLHLSPECRGYGWSMGTRTLIDPAASNPKIPVGEFGWSGAGGAYYVIDPKTRFALYFDMQVLGYTPGPQLHLNLRDAFYELLRNRL